MTKFRISGVAVDSCLQPRDSAADVSPLGSQWADGFNAALKLCITYFQVILFVLHTRLLEKYYVFEKIKHFNSVRY